MANPILNLGNNEWATKSESLLGYSKSGSNFKPVPFTHSRASIGTTIDRNGVLQTEAVNIPRIDFKDNIKGSLLLEPSRQNRITNSSEFGTDPSSPINITITRNQITAPDGTLTADRILDNSLNGEHLLSQGYTGSIVNGTTYVVSAFLKSDGTGGKGVLRFYTGSFQYAVFNLENGTVSFTSTGTSKIENYGNGWFRCSLAVTATSDYNSSILQIAIGNSLNQFNYQGATSLGCYLWGAQFEEGSYPTSYIQTEGSAVTRTVDDFENTDGVSLSGDFTYFVHIKNFDDKTLGNFPLQFFFRQSASPFSYFRFLLEANERFYAQLRDNNTATTVFNQFSDTLSNLGDNIKLAFAKSGTSCKYYVNGTLVLSSTITDFNYTLNRINHTTGNDQPAKLSQVMVFDTALTDEELTTLTTL